MDFGLNESILNELKNISKKYKYKFYIFGSRARGDYKKTSDIDIAIKGQVTSKEKFQIRNELDLLEIPYMIDIVFMQDIKNVELEKNINNQGVEI